MFITLGLLIERGDEMRCDCGPRCPQSPRALGLDVEVQARGGVRVNVAHGTKSMFCSVSSGRGLVAAIRAPALKHAN